MDSSHRLIEPGRGKSGRTSGAVGSSAVEIEDLRLITTRLRANKRATTPRRKTFSRPLPKDGK
jgi:hypothetical protein